MGEWDVRALLGHIGRAFTTIEVYLAAASAIDPASEPELASAAAYYRKAAAGLASAAAVTQRGIEAGRALGDNPSGALADMVQRVTVLLDSTDDLALLATPVGLMRLVDYLPTRAFEVSVHSLDLARATQQDLPEDSAATLPACLALCAELASTEDRVALLLAATGRAPLATGFTVL